MCSMNVVMRRLYRPLSKDKWRLTGAASIVVDTATPTVLKTDDREEIVVFSWSSVVLPRERAMMPSTADVIKMIFILT
ncbi:uncharacterized protein N7479_008901 [Penicillium vulpinum]|uniref:uncharacterized protein n=1 Tax=Penicillium vulpinum TaxID=29845 RepID=UPI0025490FE1|nr:uncharacterized protein N7479_008901 [Penicillium vulpinum]KAJ5950488.1 hypothetical protein N7479_008901 [Penicillium vulpinum]